MKDSYTRNVTMYCPDCGGNTFQSIEDIQYSLSDAPDTTMLKCTNCSSHFSKYELKEYNQDIINANFEELKNEVISDVKKDFEKMLKNAFKRH